jgi:hypothetical protein
MKKLLIFLCIFSCSTIFAQNITTSIDVNLQEKEQGDTLARFYRFSVEQTIIIENSYTDFITLNLENMPAFATYIPDYTLPKLSIFIKSDKNQQFQSVENYEFNGQQLAFAIEKNCRNVIKLDFEYIPLFFIQYMESAFHINAYLYDQQSWFFSCENMKIENISVFLPDYFYFLSNIPAVFTENHYNIKTDKLNDFNVFLIFLNKECYNKCQFSTKTDTTNLYFLRNDFLIKANSDSTSFYIAKNDSMNNESSLQDKSNFVKATKKRLNKFFTTQKNHLLNIIDGELTYEKASWGQTLNFYKEQSLVVIDSAFWQYRTGIIHEIIHTYITEKPFKTDSAYFFLSESLVEYLAVSLFNSEMQQAKIFDEKWENTNRHEYQNISVFSLQDNRMNAETASGNSVVIYDKTPYKIYKFAQSVGNKKFISILSKFYKYTSKKGYIYFSDFENIMKQNGVSDKQWNDFIKDL